MAENSGISWTDATFNSWWGCAKVSPACANCYAERDSRRWGFDVWGLGGGRRFFGDAHWAEPFKWNRMAEKAGVRKRVFCASMADVCERHDDPRTSDRMEVERFRLGLTIASTPWLNWLLLTKRPENALALLPPSMFGRAAKVGETAEQDRYPDNVWWGTTVENQKYADGRLPYLLLLPAAVRFISYEPALGPLDLQPYFGALGDRYSRCELDWVIAGGESGPRARPSAPAWFRSVRDQCVSANVPFHFKQWGEYVDAHEISQAGYDDVVENERMTVVEGAPMWRVGKKASGRRLDGQVWDEFPREARP